MDIHSSQPSQSAVPSLPWAAFQDAIQSSLLISPSMAFQVWRSWREKNSGFDAHRCAHRFESPGCGSDSVKLCVKASSNIMALRSQAHSALGFDDRDVRL